MLGMHPKPFLKEKEVCERLGVDRTTLWRWRRDPEEDFPKPCRAYKQGIVWVAEEIDEYLKGRRLPY